MKNYLLQQDDCAPDALEYFIKDLKEKFDIDFNIFKDKSEVKSLECEYYTEYHYNGYFLEISADDPYYKLAKADQSLFLKEEFKSFISRKKGAKLRQ